MNNTYYIRIDKGEKVVETIKEICQKENIQSGYFQGIGACDVVTTSTYIPEKSDFINHTISGMIEMVSLMGNISRDNNDNAFEHSHAVFSYLNDKGEVTVTAGHLKEAQISYTGEIVLVKGEERINRMFDTTTGIDVWKLSY